MPPEQARGEAVDARADVFALGAILCEILTGEPPYTGPDTLVAAWAADLTTAHGRLDACGADADLVALARRCLAADPAARPSAAAGVAEAVGAYRAGVADRLRRAEQERAAAEVRAAEEHKRLLVQRLLTVAGLVILALVVGGWWWYDRQRTEGRLAVSAGLDTAGDALAEQRLDAADAALAEAGRRLGNGGPADLRERRDALVRDRDLSRRLDRAFQARWTLADGDFQLRIARDAYAAAFADAGLTLGDTTALVAAVEAARIKDRLVAGLEDWLALTDDAKELAALAAVLNALDDDALRREARSAVVRRDAAALRALASRLGVDRLAAGEALSARLALLLAEQEAVPREDRLRLLRAARDRFPDDVTLAFQFGGLRAAPAAAVPEPVALAEAEGAFRIILARLPGNPAGWHNLAVVLRDRGDLDGALAACRKALDLQPANVAARSNLGVVLRDRKDFAGAEAAFRAAIDRNPAYAPAHGNLAVALYGRGDLDGALAACRKAVDLDPKLAIAHANLGELLREKKDLAGAVAAFRAALDRDPNLAMAQLNLGMALLEQEDIDAAVAAFRKASELNPGLALAHHNLGFALSLKGDTDAALAALRRATEVDPNLALGYRTLGAVLASRQEYEPALAAYRKAIDLRPTWADAHFLQGEALLLQGRFAEARASLERAEELSRPAGPAPALAKRLAEARVWPDLDARLPRLLAGEEKVAAATEAGEFAMGYLYVRKRYAEAAGLLRRCFAREPALLEDLDGGYRYNAACVAVLAAAGEGLNPPAEADRAALRREALAWLRADLAARKKADNLGLADWLTDTDLASIREPAALAKLTDRAEWERLWSEVRAAVAGKPGG